MNLRYSPTTSIDVEALHAQLRDGVASPDGVLTFEQAFALVEEIRRLRSALTEREDQIERLTLRADTLAGMLS
jgi:hypothetical protein